MSVAEAIVEAAWIIAYALVISALLRGVLNK